MIIFTHDMALNVMGVIQGAILWQGHGATKAARGIIENHAVGQYFGNNALPFGSIVAPGVPFGFQVYFLSIRYSIDSPASLIARVSRDGN